MSPIYTSTDIMMNSTNINMMNSIQHLDPIIWTLIDLITNTKHATDCKHVMAVALHQQGITTFDHLREFPYSAEFHGRFSYYKQQDSGTINGKDVFIVVGIKMYIQWLVLWCIHRKENKNDHNSNNPLEWTQDEFRHFKTGYRNYSITPTTGPTIGYDEYINNKNRSIMNDATVIDVDIDEVINKSDIISSNDVVVDNDKCSDDFPSLASDLSKKKLSKKKKKTPSSKKKKIPSLIMDPSNEKSHSKKKTIPTSKKKKKNKIPSTSKKKEKMKIPSTSKKKDNDLSQVGVLYALEREKQSKSTTLSNTMVSSTTTNSFKPGGGKRYVRILPPETTNDSITSIEQAVDLVDSSKLPKKRIDDLSKLETEVAKTNFESSSHTTSPISTSPLSTSPISTSNVEVGIGILMVSTTISHGMATNINDDSDCSNFRENSNDVNNKYCLSTTKLKENINNVNQKNNKYCLSTTKNINYVALKETYEFPVTVDVVTYNNNIANNNIINIADESADTSTINDTVFQPGNDDFDDVNDDDNNDVVADSTSSSESDDNIDAIFADPNGEHNYGVIASLPIHSTNNNNNSNNDNYTYSPSYVTDDIDNGEFEHDEFNDNENHNNNNAAVTITNSNDDDDSVLNDEYDHDYDIRNNTRNNPNGEFFETQSVHKDTACLSIDDDTMVVTSSSSLPTMIDGEFTVFRSTNRADNSYNGSVIDDTTNDYVDTIDVGCIHNNNGYSFDDNEMIDSYVYDEEKIGKMIGPDDVSKEMMVNKEEQENNIILHDGNGNHIIKGIDNNDSVYTAVINSNSNHYDGNDNIYYDGPNIKFRSTNDNISSNYSRIETTNKTDDDINNNDDGSDNTNDNDDDDVSVSVSLIVIFSDIYVSFDPRKLMNTNGEYNDKDIAPSNVPISIDFGSSTHNNNNDACSDVIDVDNHNNNYGILFGSFSEIHYDEYVTDEKDNKNNNDKSTTVDNNVYVTTDTCSDAIDVGIHNNSDDDYSGAIDVGIHNNNEGYYFGTFDEVHYIDETTSSVPVKLDQGSNQDDSNCAVVFPSNKNHTNCFDSDEFDSMGLMCL